MKLTNSILLGLSLFTITSSLAQQQNPLPMACIDGLGAGWRALTLKDFTNVNCLPETWTTKDDLIQCTGQPVGVTRSRQIYTNFELVVEWKHLKSGGNSGVFVW